MKFNRFFFFSLSCFIALRSIEAQSGPETIRGRITDDSSHAVVATVMVTRGPDRLTQQTTSDALLPMFERMLATPMADRKNSQWQFGFPVLFTDPKP